jgi:hypothetical protein
MTSIEAVRSSITGITGHRVEMDKYNPFELELELRYGCIETLSQRGHDITRTATWSTQTRQPQPSQLPFSDRRLSPNCPKQCLPRMIPVVGN